MPGYINTCQVGNILCIDTKCCIHEDATLTHFLVYLYNFSNLTRMCVKLKDILLRLLPKCAFTKGGH